MSNRGRTTAADDEVDQLLRAAHDDVLLKLNVNSHIAHASASASTSMDPDLDRRFQALKKPQNPTKRGDDSRTPVAPKTGSGPDRAAAAAATAADDDLFARFAALKKSLPSHNKNGNQSDVLVTDEAKEEESEDEVEKLVQWAIDAARLDPSPPSDDDAEDDDSDDTDSDDDYGRKGRSNKVTKK